VLGFAISTVVKTVGLTLRMRIDDPAGVVDSPPDHPLIWAFWHNRIFAMPVFYRRYLPGRRGAVLTSASRDGGVLAEALRRFGVDSVRGSSSRRGARAMMEMVEWIEGGYDVVVTPDGPRGPKYKLQPGIVKLAQVTRAHVVPFSANYSRAVRLRSWDRFFFPVPFSEVRVTVHPPRLIPVTDGDAAFERQREQIESALGTE
jgi:lysophospholipid acyltransferase (LPLAT)-like uncharacterized protein